VTDHYETVVTFMDAGGNKTSRRFRLRGTDDAGDISALVTQQDELIGDLQAVTTAKILRIGLNRVTIDDAFLLPIDAEVENNAQITSTIYEDVLQSWTFDIPAPVDALFIGAPGSGSMYNVVDPANAALADLMADFVGSASPYTVSDGQSLLFNSWIGKRIHKRSSKG